MLGSGWGQGSCGGVQPFLQGKLVTYQLGSSPRVSDVGKGILRSLQVGFRPLARYSPAGEVATERGRPWASAQTTCPAARRYAAHPPIAAARTAGRLFDDRGIHQGVPSSLSPVCSAGGLDGSPRSSGSTS